MLMATPARGQGIDSERATAAPPWAEVYWAVTADALPKDAGDAEAAVSYSDGRLFERHDGGWREADASGRAVRNLATGNELRHDGGESEESWRVLPATHVHNVRDYGARGDFEPGKRNGDDTAPIQHAIDLAGTTDPHGVAGTVYLPAGRYHVTRTLNLTNDKGDNQHSMMTFRGDGSRGTTLYAGTGGHPVRLHRGDGDGVRAVPRVRHARQQALHGGLPLRPAGPRTTGPSTTRSPTCGST